MGAAVAAAQPGSGSGLPRRSAIKQANRTVATGLTVPVNVAKGKRPRDSTQAPGGHVHHRHSLSTAKASRAVRRELCECLGQRGRSADNGRPWKGWPPRPLLRAGCRRKRNTPGEGCAGCTTLPPLLVLNSRPLGGLCPVLVPATSRPLAGSRWCTRNCSSGEKALRTRTEGWPGATGTRGGEGKVTSVQGSGKALCGRWLLSWPSRGG